MDKLDVWTCSSTIVEEEEVSDLLLRSNISSTDYEFLVPDKYERASYPPEGYISVYKDQIKSGLRFPLHHLVVDICNRLRVSPSQLTPDAHCAIVGFILCAKLYNIPMDVKCFFSLFKVCRYRGANLYGFHERLPEMRFLEGVLLPDGEWEGQFFFLRPVGKSWNCLTDWTDVLTLSPLIETATRTSFQELARESGVLEPGFRVAGLLETDLLVHGGIQQPGQQPPQFTFKYLMHRAAVTKLKLQPEDIPPADATKKRPLSAEVSKVPIHVTPSSSSLDKVPLKERSHQEEDDRAAAHDKANFAVLGSEEGQPQCSTTPTLLALSKTLESIFVPRELYEKLEKEKQEVTAELTSTRSRVEEVTSELASTRSRVEEVTSELASTRSRVEEVTSELASSKSRLEEVTSELASTKSRVVEVTPELASTKSRVEEVTSELASTKSRVKKVTSELTSTKSRVKKVTSELTSTKSRVKKVTSELTSTKSRVKELEQEIKLYKSKRVDLEYKTSQAMVKVKMLEKRLEIVKSDSDCLHDKIKKDAIKEFKSSDEFTNTVQEEAVKYYMNGFDACKMRVMNSGKLPSGFNFDLLDVADAEWGSSPGAEDNAVTKQDKKSFKRKRT